MIKKYLFSDGKFKCHIGKQSRRTLSIAVYFEIEFSIKERNKEFFSCVFDTFA